MKRKKSYGLFIFVAVLAALNLVAVSWQGQPITDEEYKVVPQKSQNEMAQWLLGKIEPAVEQDLQTQDLLDIIVYVETPNLENVTRPVKAPFRTEMESIRQQIKQIEKQYRPKESLPPDQEIPAMIAQEFLMTELDRLEIVDLRSELDNKMDQMRKAVAAAIKKAVYPNITPVANFIAAHGGKVNAHVTTTPAVGATIPASCLSELARHPLVLAVMKDRPPEYDLNVSVPSVGYNLWWTAISPFTGDPFDFGIVDSGVQEDHPALSGFRFYSRPGSSVISNHGTHVAGIAASTDSKYRGGAYGLDAIIWANSSSIESRTMERMEWMASTASETPEVINLSFGYGTASSADYTNNDAFYDAFIHHYDIMVTKSAGNHGWGSTTMNRPAPAYNLLAVANMDDQNTTGRGDDVRRGDSSVGPTVNGRKKPDICAPGTRIISTNSDWSTEDNFISMSGTSMAAPHVAAAIILMEDAGNTTPMAQKAVLIHNADAWSCNNTETTTDDAQVLGSHWDVSYGWGYLDMVKTYYKSNDYFVDSVIPRNNNATPDDYKLYKGYMYPYEKATLVWEKRADYIAGDPPTTQYNLSNLDIRVYDESDGSLLDSDFDADDNVHQVDLVGASRDVVIKVYAQSSSFDGVSSETYALATEENFQRANPPAFDITFNMPTSVVSGASFNLTVDVKNTGDVKAHGNRVGLTVPAGFWITSGANPQSIGAIAANATAQASWTIQAASNAGTYTFTAFNQCSCYNEVYSGSAQDSISVGYPALYNNSPTIDSSVPKGFCFELKNYDWACVGINPSTDQDIKVDDNDDFLSPYRYSTYGGTTRDFVVINGHNWGNARHYVLVYSGSPSNYTIEAEWSIPDLTVGTGYAGSMPSNHVFEMYEIYLYANHEYKLTLNVTSGSADLAVYVFKPTRNDGFRGAYDWMTNSGGAGGNEQISFTTDSTGSYGIAVINENANSANYTLTVEVTFYALSDDTPVTFSAIPNYFSFQVKSYDWCGVAINPSTNHDVKVDDNSDFSSPYESSTFAGTVRDFTITNGHIWGNATHYAQVYYGSASTYTIEGQWESYDLSLGGSYSTSIDAAEVLEMYEVYLTAGKNYKLTLNIASGSADLAVFVYAPNRSSGRRNDPNWLVDSAGSGGSEEVSFTADTNGHYGIAVINENANSANYSIKVEEVVEELPDDSPQFRPEVPWDYAFQVRSYDWCAVAMRPLTPDDHHLMVDTNSTFETPYEISDFPGDISDFVLTNGHKYGNATHYARVFFGPPSPYIIEAEWEARDLSPKSPYMDEMGENEIFDLYEVHLTEGRTYDIMLHPISGTADLAIYGFEPTRNSGGRARYDFFANETGPGGPEVIPGVPIYTTGRYAIGVINENAGLANYEITVDEMIGDFNGDRIVDLRDLRIFCQQWLTDARQADLNHDSIVNFLDFAIFTSGSRPRPPSQPDEE